MKTFLFRKMDKLSLKQRFYHNLIMVGIPFFLLGVFLPISDLGWEIELPLSILGGIVVSFSVAFSEHAFFKIKKAKD